MFVGKELSEPFCSADALGGGILLTDMMAGSVNSCWLLAGAVDVLLFDMAIECGGWTEE